jgi:hypothetical protein
VPFQPPVVPPQLPVMPPQLQVLPPQPPVMPPIFQTACTLPPHVAAQLRATDPTTAHPVAISLAFKAVRGCGIGGSAMVWAQREAYTMRRVPEEDVRFIYDAVRDHVLAGEMEAAALFAEACMVKFSGM